MFEWLDERSNAKNSFQVSRQRHDFPALEHGQRCQSLQASQAVWYDTTQGQLLCSIKFHWRSRVDCSTWKINCTSCAKGGTFELYIILINSNIFAIFSVVYNVCYSVYFKRL